MQTTAVTGPDLSLPDLEADLRRARWFANWMDTRFSLLGIRFGIDHVVSLIPVAGDTLAVLAGTYPIYLAIRHRLGWSAIVRMAINLLLEWLIGITPFLGDLADVWFKANIRNLKVFERAAERIRMERFGNGFHPPDATAR
jgi:hypothetical protein